MLVEAGAPTLGKVWPGLDAWRHSDVDHRRHWGTKGPEQEAASSSNLAGVLSLQGDCLAAHARQVLLTPDPRHKAWLSHEAWKAYKAGQVPIGIAAAPTEPARPARPELVPAKQIPTPKNSPLPLNVYMLHNLAHVELNAIDLAWDTVARFSPLGLEPGFYADFAHVADDESRHLGWCLQRLEELGHAYGDMPAHNLLWEGAQVSSGDLNGRLAVVPMSQEARGLDAGPRLSAKLVGWGDNRTAAIVERIAREEKAHVAVGVAWFRRICSALEADPGTSFRVLLSELCPNLLKGPFNHETRVEVGLEQSWYDPSMWPANTPAALTQPGQGALAGAPGSPDSLSRDDVRCASTEASLASQAPVESQPSLLAIHLQVNPKVPQGLPQQPVSLHVLIPTIGRRHLPIMLASLRDQLQPQDYLTVVFDGRDEQGVFEAAQAQVAEMDVQGEVVFELKAFNNSGKVRQKYQGKKGDFVMFADDDNVYTPGALDVIRSIVWRDLDGLYMFKVEQAVKRGKKVLWGIEGIGLGTVDTACGVAPVRHVQKAKWSARWHRTYKTYCCADAEFYRQLSAAVPRTYFVDHLIYLHSGQRHNKLD
ncbi:hypothetical protein WJX72_010644 [[Myrmecia] bisecta]|uniref:Glycosyltransferase 2-like domain-containing protein n=1 Tax=[Myrmecia] bisecta TaxID=41462 RepID=A0AAW1P5T6_9CHLO